MDPSNPYGHGPPNAPPGHPAPQAYPQAQGYPQPQSSSDEQHWLSRGVTPQQYRMFNDNREMLELIAKNAATPEPQEKPWWWVVASVLCGVVGCALCGVMNYLQVGDLPEPTGALFGFMGGTVGFYAVVGWRAGNYRNTRTDEKMVLWIEMGTGMRLLVALGAIAMLGVGLTAGLWI